jgi:hypothetical protein
VSAGPSPLERARAAWGGALPDWVERLALECAQTSQARVAARLNRSASLVSTVLANRYAGSLEAVEEVVRGVLMAQTVSCPALGTIPSSTCQDWRRASHRLAGHNAQRVMMFRACNRCPLNTRPTSIPHGTGADHD